jgi:hypothetical protein
LQASSKVAHRKVTSAAGVPGWVAVRGSTTEEPALRVTLALNSAAPRKSLSTAAPAALKLLCPE